MGFCQGIRHFRQGLQVRSPLLGLALASAGGAFLGRGLFFWGAFFLLAGAFFCRRFWAWYGAAGVAAALTMVMLLRGDARMEGLENALGRAGENRAVSGRLVVGALLWPGSTVGDRRANLRTAEGERWEVVVNGKAADWQVATAYEVRGSLFLPEQARNPGAFPERKLWRAKGAVAGLRVREVEQAGSVWWLAWRRWAENGRAFVKKKMLAGLNAESTGAKVILAMVLGEKPPRQSALVEAFRLSGSLHVFAVSGLHVTLVGGLVWLVLGRLGVGRSRAALFVMLAMFGYALLTGARPPAMRASLMGVVFISAFLFRRRADLLNAWAFCLCLALWWRPGQLFDLGFQLSYGVLLSICVGVAFFERWTAKIGELDSFMPRSLLGFWQEKGMKLRVWAGGMLAVSAAAWLGSLPLIAWHFGIVTPISIAAALVMIPLTFGVLGLAFLSVAVGSIFSWGGIFLNRVNEGVAYSAARSARFFAAVPGGHYVLPSDAPGEMVIFDLKGGAATFLDAGDGVLLDAGSDWDFEGEVDAALRSWRVEPESVVLSHPDKAHVGGMPLVLEEYACRQALVPVESARSPSYSQFLELAGAGECDLVLGKKGAVYDLGEGVKMEVIWAGENGAGWLADDRGMVLRVTWRGWKFLFTGDAGLRTTGEILSAGVDVSADVVVMGRHVSGGSGELGFLQETGARAVITSGAFFPAYERTPQGWREKVEAAGIRVFDQSVTGAVTVGISEDELSLMPFLESEMTVNFQK